MGKRVGIGVGVVGGLVALLIVQSFGDIIEIESVFSDFVKIEIATLNQGETFAKVLLRNWERARTNR